MNIEQLCEYCLKKKGVTEDFPFDENTLVFKVLGKMFILIPLGNWEQGKASINLKYDPDYAEELRVEYTSIIPGFHMNKKHWNTICIHEGELQTIFIKELINHSYDMVVKSMSNKLREKL